MLSGSLEGEGEGERGKREGEERGGGERLHVLITNKRMAVR